MRKLLSIIALMVITLFGTSPPGRSASANDTERLLRQVPGNWRDGVARNIELARAEWKDGELTKAIEAYPAGSPKFRAVCFLIANLDKNLYVDYVNPNDPLNPFSPEDEDIDWAREYIWDYSTMTSELLVENVEWAFKARETLSWCRSLPEDVFFNYVLPYRSTQEPLSSWREKMFEDLFPLISGIGNTLEAVKVINALNGQRFRFDPLYYRHPEDREILVALASGAGRCEDMSNLSNYSLRALGIATTSDFTPWWPKGDNNHAWNSVYSDGRWYSFMGCEPTPTGTWNTIKSSVFGKVYRNCFSADPIMGPAPDGTKPPRLLRSPAVDVTAEYTTVTDLRLELENPARATYLCVYNYGAWQAVAGAWVDNGRVVFPDVGNQDILYCATKYVEDETGWGDNFPVAPPFTLHRDGHIEYVNVEPDTRIEPMDFAAWSNGSAFEPGTQVTLFRYARTVQTGDANGPEIAWIPVETVDVTQAEGTSAVVRFQSVPKVQGGLYILSDSNDPEALKEGVRPFALLGDVLTYY